ncbi:MAG: penicillin-binding protein 2 [Deltaproteobacteria bacterium]|nr:penicillin-binding protein 2 [Deltaproteobacteria bacterium]MBW2135488.1 penicillin-binding protein 2 [Deltaproteobacteria bacterium]
MLPELQEKIRHSLFIFAIMALTLFGLLTIRLWYLQLIKGYELRDKSEHNRIRTRDLPPWRGMIFDRQKEILVENRPAFDLMLVPEDVQDLPQLAYRLDALLGLNPQELEEKVVAARKDNALRMIRVRGDLSWEEMALIETYRYELPGVLIQIRPQREYRNDGLACHLIGYLGEITESQLKSPKFSNNKMGDYIGRRGIELALENYLSGYRGSRQVEVDALGRELRLLSSTPSTPGDNVYLTIDARLQQAAETALEGKTGAVVALDPRNGKILALASSPSFDQKVFEKGITVPYWQQIVRDKEHPLENRALRGQYPPGSTFKIIMAVAALEEKVITPQTTFYCCGALPFGNHVFHCWRRGGHGSMNLHKALVQSCDVFFYKTGLRLGIDRIAKWSRRFGLGQPTGLNLDHEKGGLVASTAWKKRRFNQSWHEGETLSVAIGQGYNLVTPLQMARVVAAIANGGIIHVPQLVDRIESPDGEVIFRSRPQVASRLEAAPQTIALVRRGLRGVVHEPGGTGRAARIPMVEVGGKTGTAQVVAKGKERWGRGGRKTQDHAWFVCFAPVENSEIALAVIIEHGGHGGSAAAPVARQVLATYFSKPAASETTLSSATQ